MASNFKLNINEYLSKCNPKDVISVNSEQWIGVEKLKAIIIKAFNISNTTTGLRAIVSSINSASQLGNSQLWFHEGEECEILRAGSQGWQKGKLKINVTLEFIPNEPEPEISPLDDIRQAEMNNNATETK
jgi:hypothetical protein